jgi:hypothetical protein
MPEDRLHDQELPLVIIHSRSETYSPLIDTYIKDPPPLRRHTSGQDRLRHMKS